MTVRLPELLYCIFHNTMLKRCTNDAIQFSHINTLKKYKHSFMLIFNESLWPQQAHNKHLGWFRHRSWRCNILPPSPACNSKFHPKVVVVRLPLPAVTLHPLVSRPTSHLTGLSVGMHHLWKKCIQIIGQYNRFYENLEFINMDMSGYYVRSQIVYTNYVSLNLHAA